MEERDMSGIDTWLQRHRSMRCVLCSRVNRISNTFPSKKTQKVMGTPGFQLGHGPHRGRGVGDGAQSTGSSKKHSGPHCLRGAYVSIWDCPTLITRTMERMTMDFF